MNLTERIKRAIGLLEEGCGYDATDQVRLFLENLQRELVGGAAMIADERRRQITDEGWTQEHDDTHLSGEIALAAACYALPTFVRLSAPVGHTKKLLERLWPWSSDSFKSTPLERVRELVKAGALIAAEIDRLERNESK